MRLADFILDRMDGILAEWEEFAATLVPHSIQMGSLTLRAHARQILEAVSKDLSEPQTRDAQAAKSRGGVTTPLGAPETAAQTHALLRARAGFNVTQLVSEYRALRASVLRLWTDFDGIGGTNVSDIIRFNEAIDQAVAEAVNHFQISVERHRNLLLGMLGHDMRNPLNCIIMTASQLAALNAGAGVSAASARLIRSGTSMQSLLDDLTDVNRTNLGLGINVAPREVDLVETAEDELDQFRAAHPERDIQFHVSGNTTGNWDGTRVQQIFRNLVSNALNHGAPGSAVRVLMRGEPSEVRLEVTNAGHLDPALIHQLFEPLRRGAVELAQQQAPDGLGLGLFIVREIAKAHGGEVEVRSASEQTTFIVRLPRREA